MNKNQKERYSNIADDLITEGSIVARTQYGVEVIGAPTYVDRQQLFAWFGKVVSFNHQLGKAASPWHDTLTSEPDRATLDYVKKLLGTLQAIRHEIEHDCLSTIVQFVRAETLADLLDQAQHLFDNGYHLAAGVIGRAVLEDHLRSISANMGCTPSKERPTLNDFNQALYRIQHYSKVKMKHIDTIASIGNDAAHNNPELEPADVRKMLSDLPELIESTS